MFEKFLDFCSVVADVIVILFVREWRLADYLHVASATKDVGAAVVSVNLVLSRILCCPVALVSYCMSCFVAAETVYVIIVS